MYITLRPKSSVKKVKVVSINRNHIIIYRTIIEFIKLVTKAR